VQARHDELYAHRLRFDQPALRQHLETGLLPSLALYQTLREGNDDQEAALAEIDQILAAMLERSGRRQLVQIMGHLPDPFVVLRIANRWAMKYRYPPEGWRFEWVEESDRCIAYDARECFYVNVLTAYGAPELTATYVQLTTCYMATSLVSPGNARRRSAGATIGATSASAARTHRVLWRNGTTRCRSQRLNRTPSQGA
jgi:hypothetical protein